MKIPEEDKNYFSDGICICFSLPGQSMRKQHRILTGGRVPLSCLQGCWGDFVAAAQQRLWSPGTAWKPPCAWMGSTDCWIIRKEWPLNFLWSLLCHYCGFISDVVTFEWSAGSVTQAAPEIPHLSSVSWLSHSEQLMRSIPTCPSFAGLSTRLHKFGYIARCFFPSFLCICSLCYWASLLRH